MLPQDPHSDHTVSLPPESPLSGGDPSPTPPPTSPSLSLGSLTRGGRWDPFWVAGVAGIGLIALIMRLWRLGQFAAPVFDEVYFPKFAENYLDGVAFFDVHPPLGKYLISVGILIFGRTEIGYRIMPALFGALMPVLVAIVAYQISRWRLFSLVAGGLMLTDGLFLVESRYGLMNVFLVVFGFVAQIFLFEGLAAAGKRRAFLLTLSGLMLGASISVKWNGLWFGVMFALIGLMIWGMAGYWRRFLVGSLTMLLGSGVAAIARLNGWEPVASQTGLLLSPGWFGLAAVLALLALWVLNYPRWWAQGLPRMGLLAEIAGLQWWHYLGCYAAMAFVFYVIQWIPHLFQNPQAGITLALDAELLPNLAKSFVAINRSVLSGHTISTLEVTDGQSVHPYCSTSLQGLATGIPALQGLLSHKIWAAGAWSWPVLGRPVGYYFSAEGGPWRGVHALGNPILWWLSIGSVLYLSGRGLRQFQGIPAYVLLGFAGNYVPWFIVSRCVFIYHHMSALAFSIMALAWVISTLLVSEAQLWRRVGLGLIAAVIACQLFFLPIWYGLPLTSSGFYQRMWFRPNPMPVLCFDAESCASTPLRIPAIPGLNWI